MAVGHGLTYLKIFGSCCVENIGGKGECRGLLRRILQKSKKDLRPG